MPKLLIVDDNYALTQYLRDELGSGEHLLGAGTHLIDTALGGLQAIERLKSEVYDLAIIELTMSNLSGEDVARFIQRGHGRGVSCPVIFLRDRRDQRPASDVAHVALLDKPFPMDRLRSAIQAALDGRALLWRRRFLRRLYSRRAEMHLEGAATTLRARDLSLGGLGVSWVTCPFCRKDAHPGRSCSRDRYYQPRAGGLALRFQVDGRTRDIPARLSYTRPGPYGTEEAGLAFEELTVGQVEAITQLLS